MSKSYNNTIPLWLSAKEMKKAVLGIVTDSRVPGEAKDTEGSNIFAIYQAFASPAEIAAMRQAFAEGVSWGEAKEKLFERIDAELAAPREKYNALMNTPDEIEDRLLAGAKKARQRSAPFIAALRESVGLSTRTAARPAAPAAVAQGSAPAQWKRYREKDGKFYFKLVAADGGVLLQSSAFERPDEVGVTIDRLLALSAQASVDSTTLALDGRVGICAEVTTVTNALAVLAGIEREKRAAKAAQD